MHPTIRKLALGAVIALCAPFVSATVLSFDDIIGPDDYASMPVDYGGLDWSRAGLSVFTGEQAPFTAHSGLGRITTDWTDGGPVASTIRFMAPSVFDGAWFAGFSDSSVRFDLYQGGALVASSADLLLSDSPAFLAAGWTGAIDTIVVRSGMQASFVMDDFTFDSAAAVPEPGSLSLMLAGLALTGAARRQYRNRRFVT